MRVLFTADIHIKLGQKSVPVEWSKNRYKLLWKEFEKHQESCDLFIIGGDTFDKLPTMEELEIFYDLVDSCKIKTIIIPGNHESVKKNTTFLTQLKRITNRLNPLVTIVDEYYSLENIDIIPYNLLKEYNPADIDFHGNILVSHFRGDIPPHVKAEVPLEMFKRWDVVLAGDLHSYENSQRNILYPGSPVTTSFHRGLVDTGVIILDTDTLKHDWIRLEVPQLIRKTIGSNDAATRTDYHHTVYQVEGDLAELGSMQDNELVDKKVLKRPTDLALMLEPDMTLSQEVKEYLLYILGLNETDVDEAIKVLQNNLSAIE